ncbi:putative serine carboxypeptidase CPVL [Amblyomma americanum]
MKASSLWVGIVLAGSLQLSSGSTDPGPLFLTPLIEACNFTEAKNRSNVTLFKEAGINANAHSGYITVNKTANSNLFFLFIEAEDQPSTAPLMLWTQGGPGFSALFGMLLQNGPLAFQLPANLSKREHSIQKNVSVIYLDVPVGAGFSFTNDTSAYSKTLADITKDIVEFLKQFLKLFPDYQGREFYAAGDSYSARYSVALAQEMLMCPRDDVNLTFEGTIGGVGFLAPILYLADSSDFLYQASMLDTNGYTAFRRQFETMRNLTATGNISYSPLVIHMLATTLFASEPKTLFQNLTLYNSQASPLYTEMPLSMLAFFAFANTSDFKKALHVGENTNFEFANPILLVSLAADFLVDIRETLEYVLNGTRVLLYTGQLDTLFPSPNLQNYFETLNWTHADKYRAAGRRIWKPYHDYYGAAAYLKSAENFTSAVVLGMGHYGAFDKPLEVHHLMMEFINRNLSFAPI